MHWALAAMRTFGVPLLLIAGCRDTAEPQPGGAEPPPKASAPATTIDRPDADAKAVITLPGRAKQTGTDLERGSLLVDTDCEAKDCLGATVEVSSGNSGFVRYLDAGGAAMFERLPDGEAVVTVRDDARPSHPLLGEAKVSLGAAGGARVEVIMSELEANATVSGMLVERGGKRASTKSGGSLVIDVNCRGFQRRITAAADGTFSAPDLLPGPCTLTGLRIDPKDPMSGANGGRIPTRLTAPANDVEVQVNDFFHR